MVKIMHRGDANNANNFESKTFFKGNSNHNIGL
jgi:hypothetical protein